MPTELQSEDSVLFIGDSITDCHHREDPQGLGDGFVKLFADILLAREPEKHIQIINRGISGDTVADLLNRWDRDVLNHKPDWLIMMIGINDVIAFLRGQEHGISPHYFAAYYRDCLKKLTIKRPDCKIILVEPFFICQSDFADRFQSEVLKTLPEYHRTVKEMSTIFDTQIIRQHAIFMRILQHQLADKYCPEPVHPNSTGHMVIAQSLYNALFR